MINQYQFMYIENVQYCPITNILRKQKSIQTVLATTYGSRCKREEKAVYFTACD